jgi:DNA-binding NarL/FixJ family response regulator
MKADHVLEGTATAAEVTVCRSVLIVAEVRFLREALAETVRRERTLSICGLSADLHQALNMTREQKPDIVLLDAAFPNGTGVVRQIRNAAPGAQVIVLAVAETEESIIA